MYQEHIICPAKVYMMFEVKDHPSPYIRDGIWAIVHSTAVGRNHDRPTLDAVKVWKEREQSHIFSYWEMEQQCECIPVASIVGTAFLYQDYDDEDMANETKLVIQVRDPHEWHNIHEVDESRR